MIYIGFLLHAYQPPTQNEYIVRKIFEESYDPVISVLENDNELFFSIDIAKSLAEQLHYSWRERIRKLYEKNRIELVNTSAYHYLLPLAPEHIILRQLKLNFEYFQKHFISNDKCPGIFIPELAFSPNLPEIIKKAGYSWIITDDGPFIYQHSNLPAHEQAPQNWIPTQNKCGVLLRSNLWSEKIANKKYSSGKEYLLELIVGQTQWQNQLQNKNDSYIVLAVDFETIGHHHKNSVSSFLIPFLNTAKEHSSICKVVALNHIFKSFKKTELPHPIISGSWSTSKTDLKNNIPFPLWDHPDNHFHRLWNEFMRLVLAAAPNRPTIALESLIDKAFYSCAPWQASHGNKEVAGWCMPLFERLIKLLLGRPEIPRLKKIYEEMELILK